ncbi:hypothetical protein JJ499_06140 [Klebsiella pneumoniae]|nr:hypothetical protein JJ499_06140 [Klebsiella pneumoniae]
MNNDIKQALSEGRIMLLLGAGSSFGSLTQTRKQVPLGEELAKILGKVRISRSFLPKLTR